MAREESADHPSSRSPQLERFLKKSALAWEIRAAISGAKQPLWLAKGNSRKLIF
jgi:hypothetical protein